MWLVAVARLERNVRHSAGGARQPLGGFVEAASSQVFAGGTGIKGTKCAGQVMGMHASASTYRRQADRIRIGVVQVFPRALQPARRGARRRKPGCGGDQFVAETFCMEIGVRFPLRKLSQQSSHQRVWARGCDLDWIILQQMGATIPAPGSLCVADEGPGIANTANLFVPFFTTKPEGSGIGLALSRQIAEAHQGSLALENRKDGNGARARLRLPLRKMQT